MFQIVELNVRMKMPGGEEKLKYQVWAKMEDKQYRQWERQVSRLMVQDCLTVCPRKLEGYEHQDEFKEALDDYLSTIPDQPRIGSLVPTATDRQSGRQSNSLLAWANDHWHPTVSSEPEVTKSCLLPVFELVKTLK